MFVMGSRRRLTHFAELVSGDHGRAEDLVQDAYIRVYRAWSRVEPGGAESYVRRCIVNGRIDWWRRPSSHERPTVDSSMARNVPDHGGAVDQRLVVLGALSKLTDRERSVIALRYYLGLNEAQTAADLGVAVGTVKSTTARALGKLRGDPNLHKEPCDAPQ